MLSVRDVLSIIFKRKLIILCFFAGLCITAFTVLKFVPATYTASSKILVKLGREDIYTPAVTSDAMTTPLLNMAREEQLNSEVEILTSENLAAQLVDKLGPEGVYPGMLNVHPWYTPKGILQGVMNAYKAFEGFFIPLTAHLTPEQKAAKHFVRKDLEVAAAGKSNVIEVKVSSKIPDVAAQLNNELVRIYLIERGRIHNDSEGGIFEKQIAEVEARLSEAQSELEAFREANEMVDVQGERTALLERQGEIRSMIVDLRGQASGRQRLGKWLAEQKAVDEKMANLGVLELEYNRLVQNVEVLGQSRQLYLQKLEEYKINQAMSNASVGNVTVISKAIAPTSPSSPKFWMVLIALLVIGVAGGIGIAILVEFLDDTVETDSDVQKYLRLPVLAKISASA
jgi:uncharacterized protein involved in exopolysaccharide biosynthesis